MMRAGLIQGRMGPAIFLELGLEMASRSHQRARSEEGKLRHFLDHFGTAPEIASSLWTRINILSVLPRNVRAEHLLWALLWMKVYGTESVLTGIAGGVDKDTFRKWAFIFVDEIAKLATQEVSITLI